MDNLQTPQDNHTELKPKGNIFSLVLLPLLAFVSFYITLAGTVTGENSFYTFIVSLIFPAAYSATMFGAKTNVQRALPIVAAIIALIMSVSSGFIKTGTQTDIVNTVITAAGLVGISAVMLLCYIKKACKTVMLTGISIVFALMSVMSLCALAVIENGYFSVPLVIEQINAVFRSIREGVMSIYETALSNEGLIETFRSALSSVLAEEEITKETLLPILEDGVDAILSIIRSCLPALLALYSMALSFAVIAFYTVFVRSMGARAQDVNGAWEYTVGGVTARVFNASLLVAILGSIIRLPSVVIVTFVNLTIILTPLLNIIALKEIYRMFRKKGIPAVLCILIMIAGFAVISGFVQIYAFELLAFAGVYITVFKERMKLINNDTENNK